MDNFEKAARLKLRFETTQGCLSTEELFDLNLTSLDTVAKKINKQLRDEGEESFLPSTTNKKATNNNLRLEILKYIINSKVEELEVLRQSVEKRAQLAQLKELAATKATEKLASQSLEDILKQIQEMEATV